MYDIKQFNLNFSGMMWQVVYLKAVFQGQLYL